MSALIFWLSAGCATALTLLSASWFIVERSAQGGRWIDNANSASQVILWLGCPPSTPAFRARVDALHELLASTVPQRIILSGTGTEIKACRALLQPTMELEIIDDDQGYRTLVSLLNAKATLFDKELTVVSHHYHLARVAYLAEGIDLPVRLYPTGRPLGSWITRGRWRELFARSRAVLDRHFPIEQPQNQTRNLS